DAVAALHLLDGLASVEPLAPPGARGDQELDEARVVPVWYLLRQLHGHAAEAIVAVERPVRDHVERVGVVAIEGMDVGAGLDERLGGFVLAPPARPVERCGLVLPSLRVGIRARRDEPPDLLGVVAAGGIAQEVRIYGGSAQPTPPRSGPGSAVFLAHQRLVRARRTQERRHVVPPVTLGVAERRDPAVVTRVDVAAGLDQEPDDGKPAALH